MDQGSKRKIISEIANLVPKLSCKAQIGSGTIKTSNLAFNLSITTQSRPVWPAGHVNWLICPSFRVDHLRCLFLPLAL
jgi:hypothetical protein